ncbi:sugar phosphate isomerase/epimerase [Novosphingobium sp. PhB165]|uniref:sugar phosphate isomerase/epimerase family protein n=1 Tax=Novosphingobium sp. PhB165 TaxID=2485105 RepID=UPI00104F1A74|nr:sugar phosphate isomerase/epimerase [Novosphingobium sp. PhB165]TCM20907.1 sugar phosphate isomerase/epimerase [Novosphingobium sp. PhB165]
MARLGIEMISVFGLPPVEFVHLAADLGCRHISTGLTAAGYNPHGYAPFSLRDDAALRRATIAAMQERGITISLGEGMNVRAGSDVRDLAGDLDVMAELGAERINTVSLDPDLARSFDQFGILAEMVAARGMETTVEFAPSLSVPDLPTALDALRHVGRADFRLLVDTMHLVRSGAGAADLAALDPDLIGYIQFCDAPLEPRFESYFEESMFERVAPGEGELGLREIVAALPHDRVYALELPLRSEAEAGVGPHARLSKCVEAARRLLAEVHGESTANA